jgi:uncharacterized membrane protein
MNQHHDSITLLEESAAPEVIESLYRTGLLSQQGREVGMDLLYPNKQWGYWIGNLLLILGWVFILSGIIYFFAFNWHKMSSAYKFSSIQVLILVCLAGAWAHSIDNLKGKLFLTGGCVLIGVFLAVFGQIYQTGADSYLLFLGWAAIIAPFVIIGQFAPLWAIWMLLVNIAVVLFWEQGLSISGEDKSYLLIVLLLLNGAALVLREILFNHKIECLQGRWHRILLCLSILIISFIPISLYIMDKGYDHTPLMLTALVGFLMQMSFLFFYRFTHRDRWVFAMTLLSLSIITCEIGYKFLSMLSLDKTLDFLLMTVIILTVFSVSAYILRKR